MDVSETSLPGVAVLWPTRHQDPRGVFAEVYSRRSFATSGIALEFVQDNISLSPSRGTIRGLHFQIPPHAQAKLVYVTHGSAFDVVVDIRRGSPTYGRHFSTTLSAAAWNQIFVPAGFAHGLCTLEADTQVVYKVTDFYAPDHDRGIIWNDPTLGIDWPVEEDQAILSGKDTRHPRFAELPAYFDYAAMTHGAGR
jgi:dTDP-4-dehydrorhamnose 3,5-epimerase